jgi:hypothetical protein
VEPLLCVWGPPYLRIDPYTENILMAGMLATLTDIFTLIFVVSSMLGMGSSLTVKEILKPVSSGRQHHHSWPFRVS